jgi:hypothetical protein
VVLVALGFRFVQGLLLGIGAFLGRYPRGRDLHVVSASSVNRVSIACVASVAAFGADVTLVVAFLRANSFSGLRDRFDAVLAFGYVAVVDPDVLRGVDVLLLVCAIAGRAIGQVALGHLHTRAVSWQVLPSALDHAHPLTVSGHVLSEVGPIALNVRLRANLSVLCVLSIFSLLYLSDFVLAVGTKVSVDGALVGTHKLTLALGISSPVFSQHGLQPCNLGLESVNGPFTLDMLLFSPLTVPELVLEKRNLSNELSHG